MKTRFNSVLNIAIWFTFLPNVAAAHTSEQGLVLLLPTTFYAAAGTLCVIATMILVTCLPRGVLAKIFTYRTLLTSGRSAGSNLRIVSSILSTIFFLILIGIGLFGPTDPQHNLLPLWIWTIWWIALFVIQGTVFDIWRWVNPWIGLAKLTRLGDVPLVKLPASGSVWPAIALFVLFQGFMLADIAPSDPRRLAIVLLGYWAFTSAGIVVFGRKFWMTRVECLTVMFSLISLIRPAQSPSLILGFPGWKALQIPPLDWSRAAFCLAILAAGSFDGVNETFWWLAQLGINPLEFPGRSAVIWPTLFGLLGSIAGLITVYAISVKFGLIALRKFNPDANVQFSTTFKAFSITFLPIALGYHIAHYLVSFLVQIRVTLSTAADPLAMGWDLFGLRAVNVTTGFLNSPDSVKMIWLTQAAVVVISHVLAVLMGHKVAENLSDDFKGTLGIQLGTTVLMIAYTVFGLWLLASPRGA